MKIPNKKLKSGFTMPVFGLGTWQMGGKRERDYHNDDAADIQAIKTAIELGITHIDTAEVYAAGYTEILVGQAIVGYKRADLFLASKVHLTNLRYDDVLRACEQSLKRLGTNYLDLYLLHRYNPSIPLADSIRALDRLVNEKVVRNIGVSNFTWQHLAAAQSYSANQIVCNQVHYNLIFREPERTGLLEYCQNNDVFLVAWRPLGKSSILENIPAVVKEVCSHYQKTPAQLAINWLISQANVVTLSKMRQIEHLQENLGGIGWQMDNKDIARLRRDYPNQQDISDTVPLA